MAESESKFLLKTIYRYLFHLSAFIVFAFLSPRLYFDFQNLAIRVCSRIKYTDDIKTSPEWLLVILTVGLLCYREDYLTIKKAKLNEYYILPMLAADIICIIIATFLMIIYNNIYYSKLTIASTDSLNNPLIAFLLIVLKNWLIESVLKKRSITTFKLAGSQS